MTTYGEKLNPYRKLIEPRNVKRIRQSIVIANNPNTIDQNQQLLVRFPDLSNNDVIVPRRICLAFEIEIKSTDAISTIYQNIGRSIIKKRFSGNEVMSIDDNDIYHCYSDLWRCPTERSNMAYQSTGKDGMLKHIFGAGNAPADKEDEAFADAYKNRFCIPLNFENA